MIKQPFTSTVIRTNHRRRRRTARRCQVLASLLCLLLPATAQADKLVVTTEKPDTEPFSAVLPYAFSSQPTGFVLGAAGAFSGMPQPQSSLFVTALVSSNKARAAYLFFNDYQLPFSERLFSDVDIGIGNFPRMRGYFNTPYTPFDPPAGSNESNPDDYFETQGYSNWFDLDLKYLLNAGHGRRNPINIYTLHQGLLVAGATGGEHWNPFESGRSYVETRLFYQDRLYELPDGTARLTSSGARLTLRYDNTDFPVNPSRGSKMLAAISRDPGWGASTDAWTFAEFEASKYFHLQPDAYTEQRVLALSLWTGNSLTWEERQTPDGPVVAHRPPPFYGATLGGLYRLRAYPIERFNDRAAIYYGLEYRVIPKSAIFHRISWLEIVGFQWWEVVAFAEAGRVAPSWDLKLLHTRMKSDIGMGLRVMASNNIGRLDFAVSSEQFTIWAVVGHPF